MYVPAILVYWVLELKSEPVKNLGPSLLFLVRKNPAFVVLRLDYEYAESG